MSARTGLFRRFGRKLKMQPSPRMRPFRVDGLRRRLRSDNNTGSECGCGMSFLHTRRSMKPARRAVGIGGADAASYGMLSDRGLMWYHRPNRAAGRRDQAGIQGPPHQTVRLHRAGINLSVMLADGVPLLTASATSSRPWRTLFPAHHHEIKSPSKEARALPMPLHCIVTFSRISLCGGRSVWKTADWTAV